MRSENVTNSDGVTFRLYANGTKLFDYHQTNDVWRPFEYDFTALRGSNLTVRFEVDPGPNNNASFDYSFWGNRQLVLEGYTPPVSDRPAAALVALSNLWSGQTTEVAPPSGFPGTSTVSLSSDVVHFRYTGSDGTLEYQWHRPAIGQRRSLRHDHSQRPDDRRHARSRCRWPIRRRYPGTKPPPPSPAAGLQTDTGYTLWRTFNVGSTTATVRITGQLVGKSLALAVTCDKP